MGIALATTLEERLLDLGNVPAARVRIEPSPGKSTVEDLVRLRNTERRLYELVDGTLVEKAMGWQESFLAGILLQWLNNYLDQHRLGVATGPDGMTRLFGDTVRLPLPGWQVDVADLFGRLDRDSKQMESRDR
jgi:Putative restriction endonuclease